MGYLRSGFLVWFIRLGLYFFILGSMLAPMDKFWVMLGVLMLDGILASRAYRVVKAEALLREWRIASQEGYRPTERELNYLGRHELSARVQA